MKDLALITSDDLSLVSDNVLNDLQLKQILKATPKQYIKERPAKGGGKWQYVTGGYVRKCLNIMFGWDWSFEILDEKIIHGEVVVKGKLLCRVSGREIVKTQYGNKDIMYRKQTDSEKAQKAERIPLSIGNDMKAAATDCLKKCAAEIGIAADIYNAEDFKAVNVLTNDDVTLSDIEMLFDSVKGNLTPNEYKDIDRVITNQEKESYAKAFKFLNKKTNQHE